MVSVNVSLENELDMLLAENQLLKQDAVKFNEQVENEKANHSKVHAELEELQLKTTEEKKELQHRVEGYKKTVKELENEQFCAQNAHKLEVEKLQKDLKEAESKIQLLNSKLENLYPTQEVLVSENLRLSNTINTLKQDAVKFNEQVTNEKANHSKLHAELEALHLKTTEEKKELQHRVEGYKKTVKELENEQFCAQNAHKLEVEKLQKDLKEAESKIHSLNSKLEDLSSVNKTLVSEYSSSSNTINTLKQEKLSAEKTVKSLESKVQTLKKKLHDTEIDQQNHDKTVENLKNDLNNFREQLQVFEIQNTNQTEKWSKLKDENRCLKNELAAARSENKKGAKTVTNLRDENKSYGEKLESIESKNKELVEKVESFENKKKELVEEVDSLKSEKVYLTKELEKIDADNEKLSEQIVTLKSGNKKLSNNTKILKLEAKRQEKQKEVLVTKHENEMSELNEKINEAEKQIQTCSKNIKELESELEEQKKTLSSKVQHLKEELENERELATKPKIPALDYTFEIEKLTRDLTQERMKSATNSVNFTKLKKIASDFEAESKRIKPLMNQVETLKLDKNYLSGQLAARLQELKKQQSTIESLKFEVKELRKLNKELKQQEVVHSTTIRTINNKVEANLTLIKNQEEELQKQQLVMRLQKTTLLTYEQKFLKFEKEIEETAFSLKQANTKVNTRTKEIQYLKNQWKNLEVANAKLLKELNAEKQEAQKMNQQQKEKIVELLQNEINSREELDKLYDALREKTRENGDAKEEIGNLKKDKNTIEARQKKEVCKTCIAALGSELDRKKSEVEHAKIMPATTTPKNILECTDNKILEEVSDDDDEFQDLSTAMNPTREKMKQTPYHDDAVDSFEPISKRPRLIDYPDSSEEIFE
ncbi:unnamed protein product [Orchesella dallaii]|uniref:Uncharacterized protein n=1 Tax=Orchesella dallaii TaxID=48710 RepID=A0ABP1RHX9_9HEXA